MPRELFLSHDKCAVVIGERLIEGFAEGDSIRIIPNAEGSAVSAGLDGAVTLFTNNWTGTIELDLKPTSPSLDWIYRVWKDQKSGNARLLNGAITTDANEPWGFSGVSLLSVGQANSGGTTPSLRTIVWNVEKIDPPNP